LKVILAVRNPYKSNIVEL